MGYLNVNKIAGYNENAILTCLRANKPIYIRAASPKSESYTNKRSRHGWIIDGFIKRQRLSNIEIMMHCNMGWSGSCDGYYASSIFRTTSTMDEEGNILGQHRGLIHYTIGQRKGLGISFGKPAYVIDKDAQKNTVTIGSSDISTRASLRPTF